MIMHAVRVCGPRMKTELLYDRYDTKQMYCRGIKGTHLEILPQLLE